MTSEGEQISLFLSLPLHRAIPGCFSCQDAKSQSFLQQSVELLEQSAEQIFLKLHCLYGKIKNLLWV